jgi:carbamoyl-phosphate synthase large subunit
VARRIADLGLSIIATAGTAKYLQDHGVACATVNKISQGRPHILDKIQDKEIAWIINTSMGSRTTEDSYFIRRSALDYHLPYSTTTTGALSMVKAIETMKKKEMRVKSVQEYFVDQQ